MRRLVVVACAFGAFSFAACEQSKSVGTDDMADFTGPYSLSLINGQTTCVGTDWKPGEVHTGLTLSITQQGDQATAKVEGLPAIVVGLGFGSTEYKGTVVGHTAQLTLYGNRGMMNGTCAYTNKSVVDAKLQGDFISGTVTYTPEVSANPDCAAIVCKSVQTFNGTRPPRLGG